MKARHRLKMVISGRPRSGKSHYARQFAKKYTQRQGLAFVYNYLSPGDFEEFQAVELEPGGIFHAPGQEPEELGRLHNIPANGSKFPRVKAHRLKLDQDSNQFYDLYAEQVNNSVLIIDDASTITPSGRVIPPYLKNIFATADHLGIDIVMIYHGVNYIPNELFTYLTHLVQFEELAQPRKSKAEIFPDFHILEHNHRKLKKLPPYYFCEVDFLSGTNNLYKPLNY